MDVKERCHRILMKLVGTRESVLVVAHKVILQVIMSYFLDIPAEQMPSIEVKENTVYELGADGILHQDERMYSTE